MQIRNPLRVVWGRRARSAAGYRIRRPLHTRRAGCGVRMGDWEDHGGQVSGGVVEIQVGAPGLFMIGRHVQPNRVARARSAPSGGAMRVEKFSERARRVLSLAQEEAQRFNHSYIGSEHNLLSLIRQTVLQLGR